MRPGEPNPLAEQARAYAAGGWSVLPLWWPTRAGDCACGLPDCESAAQHPIRRLVPHGLLDATSHAATVDGWWRSHPHANVGIRTGVESGLVVLDVDGEAGRLAMRGLVAHHATFEALWVRTGSGGWHAYFAHPGTAVPSSVGRLGEGLDVRGEGGYVVAPPSRHESHRRYRWIAAPAETSELPALPGWLLDLALPPTRDGHAPQPVWLLSGDASAYATAALDREAHEVGQAPAGQRNARLNEAAFKLGQLVGAGLIDETTVARALVSAALAAGPGERKIRSTVNRGLRAGISRPRRVLLRGLAGREAGRC
jgi:hypothetical protein